MGFLCTFICSEQKVGCFVQGGRNGMGCFVWGGINGMGYFVQGGKSRVGCLSRLGNLCGMFCVCQKMAWDVLSRDVLSCILLE